MKTIFHLFSLAVIATILLTACTPDQFSLGSKDVDPSELVKGIAYTITPDASNPNIIYLETKMDPKYKPLWVTPQGRSQANKVTLQMPFAGEYQVTFGVLTDGGYVYGAPSTFTIDNMYAGFISDPLWTLISGGSGKSKTWYLDLNASGQSRYFAGPLYFYGADDWWGNVTDGGAALGSDSWNWCPDYAGNTWLMAAIDYGSMTFDLINGANITVNNLSTGVDETGTYMLDVTAKTLTLNGAKMLHDSGRDTHTIGDWHDIRLISLTENTMQLGVQRNPDTSGEGPCLLVYNFISKDYYDNWTPTVPPTPTEPTLPSGWESSVSQTVSTTIKWKLSPNTPFNWANLDGSLMNADWTAADKYADWTGMNTTIPASYEKFALTMDSKAKTVVYTDPSGNETNGTYTLDTKGVYTFDGVKPNFTICGGWVNLSTTAENQWRITHIDQDASGNVTGMWVGALATDKPEYMVYYLIPEAGNSTTPQTPQGTDITFDAAKVKYGDLENNGKLRIELYNAYGSTKDDPCMALDAMHYASGFEIEFTLAGVTLNAGAAGTYDAAIYYANSSWGGTTATPATAVTGDGTYVVKAAGTNAEDTQVFVIDITGLAADIADLSAVTVTVNRITVY